MENSNYGKSLIETLIVLHNREILYESKVSKSAKDMIELTKIHEVKKLVLEKLDLVLDAFDIFESNAIIYDKQGMIMSVINRVENTDDFTKLRNTLKEIEEEKA